MPKPPDAERVARRALVLSAVTCRGCIEADAGQDYARELHAKLGAWTTKLRLASEMEKAEAAVIRAPLGELTPRDTINASWRAEGLVVLAWALKRFPKPPHDQMIDPQAVANSVGFLGVRLPDPALRPAKEIGLFADLSFALHWRLRDYSVRPKAVDFRSVGRHEWMGTLGIEQLPLLKKDLAIRGKPISKSDEADWRQCLSIALERHQAANWLLGDHRVYSKVATDT